jgi:GTP-sensing pleiotropic transcriptional regulator CodY
MKSLTETSILLTSTLRDLNQEIQQRLSSTRCCTVQEMRNLVRWQEEAQLLVNVLENDLCIISQHTQLLKQELQQRQPKVTSVA